MVFGPNSTTWRALSDWRILLCGGRSLMKALLQARLAPIRDPTLVERSIFMWHSSRRFLRGDLRANPHHFCSFRPCLLVATY
jgi:hypothetical protein